MNCPECGKKLALIISHVNGKPEESSEEWVCVYCLDKEEQCILLGDVLEHLINTPF